MQYATRLVVLLACVVAQKFSLGFADDGNTHHEYCVIGAGPGGLQMAYFLQQAGRDYIVYEKGHAAGMFYTKFPIHRTLISINKRNTGKTNKEFNFRHDWNSLISHDESLRMGRYSKDIFPPADLFVKYLNDFAQKLEINIKYNTTIGNLQKRNEEDGQFHVTDQNENKYTCTYIIVATGISKPNIPESESLKNIATGYHELSLDLDQFEGKSVLILGRGNSGFETAQHIMGRTNYIHMLGRSRVKLAWSTHYVGDLRAVNNGLLDTYQLKSLDGIVEGDINLLPMSRNEQDGRFYLDYDSLNESASDNSALREGYDMVIACLGFRFDLSIFSDSSVGGRSKLESLSFLSHRHKKYPRMTRQYESSVFPGVFFAGTNTHTLDFKLSAGGFIHGFRYTTRALHRILENRHHNIPWPSTRFQSAIEAIPHMLKRLNEASDIYQMFGVLCDVILFSEDNVQATYLEAYPCASVSRIQNVTGHSTPGKLVIVALEYGKNASGPGKDVFHEERATLQPEEAHTCNFLHPVLYYYNEIPTDRAVFWKRKKWILPIPDRIHHIVEDFTTVFDAPVNHILAVRRFFETILGRDLRPYYVEQCLSGSLVSSVLPESCRIYDMNGLGISPSKQQKENLALMQPWLAQKMGVNIF